MSVLLSPRCCWIGTATKSEDCIWVVVVVVVAFWPLAILTDAPPKLNISNNAMQTKTICTFN